MIILYNMSREYLKKRYICNSNNNLLQRKVHIIKQKTHLPPPLHCQMMVAKDDLSSGFVHPIEAMLLVPLLQ